MEVFQDRDRVRSSGTLAKEMTQGRGRADPGSIRLDSPPAENVPLRWLQL